MKIFQTIQKNLEIFGISSVQPAQTYCNRKILLYLLSCGSLIIMNCIFLIHVAKSFKEYTDSIYITSVSVALFVSFSFLIRRIANLFEFIDSLEKIINDSEYSNYICWIRYSKIISNIQIWKKKKIYLRIGMCRIQRKIWKDQSRNRKMEWNRVLSHGKSHRHMFIITKVYG